MFQNLGSSLGTALIASLATSFVGAVDARSLSASTKSAVTSATESGVAIVPLSSIEGIATDADLSSTENAQLASIYGDSQVNSLRLSFFALIIFSVIAVLFSKKIPTEKVGCRRKKTVNSASDDLQ